MCVPKAARWVDSLRTTLHRVYEPTTRQPVPWLVSGEAALALQGVDVDPAVIEFRAVSPFAVAYFAGFMRAYEVQANSATVIYRRGGVTPPSEGWRSNVHQRIVAWVAGDDAYWFGRWNVEGLSAQVLYARTTGADPLSNMQPSDIRYVPLNGMNVAVVPIEILLADSALSGPTQETNRILHAMRQAGYDEEILRKALDVLPQDKALRLLRLLEIRLVAG